jgi:hypothetical protein
MSSPPTASATAEQQQQRARCWVRVDTESGQLCLDDTSAGFDQVLGRSGEDGTDNPTDATPPTLPVVSVQGLARTGKSTLMNVLAGNDGCFEARGGDTSVTTGVQGVLLVGAQHLAGTPGTETGDMVLLDNEGSGEDDSVTDMQELFTLEQSQLTIYNYSHANGVVQKQTLLRALSRYAQHHGTYARRRGSDDSRDECGDEDAGGGATGARRRWGALLILVRDCDCSGSSESPAEWEDRMFERVFGSARNGVGMAQAVLDTFTDVCFHAMPNLHGLSAQQRASLPAVVQLRARLEGLLAAGSRQVPLLRCSELRAYGSQFIGSINAAGPIPSPFDLVISRNRQRRADVLASRFHVFANAQLGTACAESDVPDAFTIDSMQQILEVERQRYVASLQREYPEIANDLSLPRLAASTAVVMDDVLSQMAERVAEAEAARRVVKHSDVLIPGKHSIESLAFTLIQAYISVATGGMATAAFDAVLKGFVTRLLVAEAGQHIDDPVIRGIACAAVGAGVDAALSGAAMDSVVDAAAKAAAPALSAQVAGEMTGSDTVAAAVGAGCASFGNNSGAFCKAATAGAIKAKLVESADKYPILHKTGISNAIGSLVANGSVDRLCEQYRRGDVNTASNIHGNDDIEEGVPPQTDQLQDQETMPIVSEGIPGMVGDAATNDLATTVDAATNGLATTADAATTGQVTTADVATTGLATTADAATTGQVTTADVATTGLATTAVAATTRLVTTADADAATTGLATAADGRGITGRQESLPLVYTCTTPDLLGNAKRAIESVANIRVPVETNLSMNSEGQANLGVSVNLGYVSLSGEQNLTNKEVNGSITVRNPFCPLFAKTFDKDGVTSSFGVGSLSVSRQESHSDHYARTVGMMTGNPMAALLAQQILDGKVKLGEKGFEVAKESEPERE